MPSGSRSVISDCLRPQAPLSMGFPRQEYWSGLPFPPPEDLPNPRIKPRSPALQYSLLSEPPGKPYNIANYRQKRTCPLRFRLCALLRRHISESTLCGYIPFVSNGIKSEWEDEICTHIAFFSFKENTMLLVCVKVSVLSHSLWPPGIYSLWNSPGQNTRVGSCSLLGNLPNPGIELTSPTSQVDSLPGSQ